MSGDTHIDLTAIIANCRAGDQAARDQLFEVIYNELRQLAARSRYVGDEGQTMQPTALANEAFIELSRRFGLPDHAEPADRQAFFLTVARAMRTILRDNWRMKNAAKRGAGAPAVAHPELDAVAKATTGEWQNVDFLDLDAALVRLEEYNPRWHEVVMHRYFAGRSIADTAELMGIGQTSIKSDWKYARAWLSRELAD